MGVLVLAIVALVVTYLDLISRARFHLNFYPLLIVVGVLLFRKLGLLTVIVSVGLFHAVSLTHGWESMRLIVGNLGQLAVGTLVGGLCLAAVLFYSKTLAQSQKLSEARRDTVDFLIHEIRNPLFVARGTLQIMRRAPNPPPDLDLVLHQLKTIESSLERLHEAHRDDGVLQLELEQVEVATLLEEMAGKFSQMDKRHQYKVNCPQDSPLVLCDQSLTKKILENVLGNAIKYAEPGAVELKATKHRSEICITVTDSGPGVGDEERELIFEQHQRGKSAKDDNTGLGVGLYLSRKYARNQGGELKALAGPQGTFELRLPAAKKVSAVGSSTPKDE